jgi:hypothetical protein
MYLETQKSANMLSTIGNAHTTVMNPAMAGGVINALGSGLKSLGGFIKGKTTAGARHATGNFLERAGKGSEKLGEYTSDVAHGILNAGPGIEYDASKLPSLMGFEQRIGTGKKTKLTAQRGLLWAGGAVGAGEAAGALMKAFKGPEKQAREDAAALIAFWENSV